MSPSPRVVAIDGPAGSGKSTLARGLAEVLGLPYVNTGAMYRALTALALRRRVAPTDAEALAALIDHLRFTLDDRDPPELLIDGASDADLTTLDVETTVSIVASHPEVRTKLRAAQRAIGRGGAVMEGRDIGTAVFPDAPVKLYLDAGLGTRAARRANERSAADETTEDALQTRDRRDARTNPLEPAPGASVIETGKLGIDATLERALEIVRRVAPELLS